MRLIMSWGGLIGVIAFAIISGGPTAHGWGGQVRGGFPTAAVPCDTTTLQNKKCNKKDGTYCSVDFKQCRAAQTGETNTDLCIYQGATAVACKDPACDDPLNPPNSDSTTQKCTNNSPP